MDLTWANYVMYYHRVIRKLVMRDVENYGLVAGYELTGSSSRFRVHCTIKVAQQPTVGSSSFKHVIYRFLYALKFQ